MQAHIKTVWNLFAHPLFEKLSKGVATEAPKVSMLFAAPTASLHSLAAIAVISFIFDYFSCADTVFQMKISDGAPKLNAEGFPTPFLVLRTSTRHPLRPPVGVQAPLEF